ncbi:MAG: primosomal protein N', partial [Cytophagaceae bacterium]|nr:primosomal protein N' [Cytophagaceae bacterium]
LLTPHEAAILEELKKQDSLSYDELARLAEVTNVYHLIKSLVGKRAILVFEEVREKYTPKIVRMVRLKAPFDEPEMVKGLIAELDKPQTQKQLEVLVQYLRDVPVLRDPAANSRGIAKAGFAKSDISSSSLDTLLKKEIFETFDMVVSRFADSNQNVTTVTLTAAQETARHEIMAAFAEKDSVLLHGITGSGKTEVYIRLIEQVLAGGSQVLYLLPEIALTTQIVVRLKKIFGDKVGIYHSKFSDNERVEVWKGVLAGKYQFVVGVRSAVFLPFDNLGLIIVDEEHETSYKQFDPAPRYHARDVALMIARHQHAKVLLGSATPSIETYYHAQEGRYGLVKLTTRFGEAQLPEIQLIDTKVARKQKEMQGDFAKEILTRIGLNLEAGRQTLLFQNRRGYSPYLQCDDCSWIGSCHQCDVSLTYHYQGQELRCHYCGHHEPMPRVCPACGGPKVRTVGYGTEKIEDELKAFFPQARIGRMDLDTTRSKTAFQQLIQDVEQGNVDMLVGTQMISKGLDFDNVSLVCIFDADRMIHFPDFRSSERAFQLITQVSGRAGRRDTVGQVLIQTSNPANPLLQKIIENDYQGLFDDEIREREAYRYPPFTRLIKLTIKNPEQHLAKKAAETLCARLADSLTKERVLGPETPLVERIRNQFLFEILIKLERNLNLKTIKPFIAEQVEALITEKPFKSVGVVVDVDCG